MTDTRAALLCSAILFLAVLTDKTDQKRRGPATLTVISQFDLPSIKFPQGVSSNSPHPFGLQPTHQRLNIYLIVTVPSVWAPAVCKHCAKAVSRVTSWYSPYSTSCGSLSYSPHFVNKKTSSERGSDLPKVTQPASGRARTASPAVWLPAGLLTPHSNFQREDSICSTPPFVEVQRVGQSWKGPEKWPNPMILNSS